MNAGTEPVYALRIGHERGAAWGQDLLGSTGIVDVGASQRVNLALVSGCRYDVLAQYRDGHSELLPQVDLCKARRLFLSH